MALVQELAIGVYLGVLTGVFAALLVFVLAFTFQYVAGVNFPAMYGMIIGLGAAGVAGGIRVFIRNPSLLQTPTAVVTLLIVMMIALYSHKRGQKLGKTIPPKNVVLGKLRRKAISSEVIKGVGRAGKVTVRPTGEIADIEGYPPLTSEIRNAIRGGDWTFPADLPIPELERRLAEKLKHEHDLSEVTVRIDEQGRASISAAPPESGLSRRVPEDKEVVTVDVPVPKGLDRGDEVRLDLEDSRIDGRVVGVTPRVPAAKDAVESSPTSETEPDASPPDDRWTSGAGRVALAVSPDAVRAVLEKDVNRFAVKSRGENREYELVSLLRRDGIQFEKVTVTQDGGLTEKPLGEVASRERYGVSILGVKRGQEWFIAPDGSTTFQADDQLFVSGPRESLADFREVA